jgi:hypothetical protein
LNFGVYSVRILAIDPGNEQSAWCWLVHEGDILQAGKLPNAELRDMLRQGGTVWESEILCVEMIASYGMAVGKEVFDTCVWIGKFAEAWESRGGTVRFIYRKEVKLHLCETTRANDANIRASIIDRFGPGKEKAVGTKKNPGPLYGFKGDEWAALAVALTAGATVAQCSAGR